MALDQTTGAAIIKDTFTDKKVQKLVNEAASQYPMWALLTKRAGKLEGKHGAKFIVPLQVNDSQNNGTSLATALTDSDTGSPEYTAFKVSPVTFYGAAKVDGVMAQLADGKDEGSFLDAMKESMESEMRSIATKFAIGTYGAGYAELGRIKTGAAPTSTTIQVRAGDVWKFRKNMKIRVSASLTSVVRTGTGTITKVAADGTLTLSGVDPTAVSWAADDYIFNARAVSTANPKTRTMFTGLAAYNPVSEPADPTTLHEVNIGSDYLLSGSRSAVSDYGVDVLKALQGHILNHATTNGKAPTHAFCNPVTWPVLAALFPDQTAYKAKSGEAQSGFDAIRIITPAGSVELISDPGCEPGEVRFLDIAHVFWTYAGNGLIHPIEDDGMLFRAHPTEDATIVRLRSILALCCDRPTALSVLTGVA